jgi:hypothetical protein
MWAFCGVSSKTAFGKVKAPEVRKQLRARRSSSATSNITL